MEANIKAYINPYIEHYLKEKEISQSILITGNWGCGKTYYWKNVLSSKIKEYNLIPIYVSLNGLKNKEDILNKWALEIIQFHSNNIINPKIIKATINLFYLVLNTLSVGKIDFKKLNLNLSLSDFLSIQKLDKYFLCFDDLERYTGNLSDVLSIINDFTEQKHIKTIVLANIDKIKTTINSDRKEQSTLSNKDINNFNIIKEKFFAKIITFPNDENTKKYILKKIINEINTDIDFISKNIELILSIMKQAQTSNYRVIKMLLDDFSFFYSKNTLNHIKDKSSFFDIQKYFFKFLLCSGLEIYINNLSDKDIVSLKSDRSFDILKFITKETTPTFLDEFINKFYLGDFKTAYIFPSIIDYHLTSKINFKTLNDEINKFSHKETKNHEYLTENASNYIYLSDSDFDKIINKDLLEDIKNGNIHYVYYDELFIKYCCLLKDKLIDKSYADLKDIFLEGLNKIQQEKKQEPVYDDDYCYALRDKYKHVLQDDYSLVFCKIEQTHGILTDNYILQKSNTLKQVLKEDTSAFLDYLNPTKNSYYEDINYPLFKQFTIEELFNILSTKTNKDILEIGIVIIEKYKSNNKSLHYSSDYTFLNKFSNYVQNKFSKQKKLALSESLILTFAKQIDSLQIQMKS